MFGVGTLIFEPVRDYLKNLLTQLFSHQPPEQSTELRIFVYGLGRSGKTTIIDSLFRDDPDIDSRRNETTPKFESEDFERILRLEDRESRKHIVSIGDYRGQDIASITNDAPENFFGSKGNRKINAIFFVVDLFPELKKDDGSVISDKELIQKYSSNAEQLIKERVQLNRLYTNKFTMQPIFQVCCNEPTKNDNLFAVRLLINKVDLLQELISLGYHRNILVYDYVIDLYSDTKKEIESYCEKNKIPAPKVKVISARRGLLYDENSQSRSIKPVISEILKIYNSKSRG